MYRFHGAILSHEIQDGAAEYLLYATRQMGTISAALERAKMQGNQYTGKMVDTEARNLPKSEILANAGIDIRRANEAEKLAAIPDEQFSEIVDKKKKAGREGEYFSER